MKKQTAKAEPKTTTTVKVAYEIENDAIESLLCSAVESGGIGHWAYVNTDSCIGSQSYRGMTVFEEDAPKRKCVLNDKKIETGIRVMALKYPHHFRDLMGGNADRTTANVFVQCAMFGECVYE